MKRLLLSFIMIGCVQPLAAAGTQVIAGGGEELSTTATQYSELVGNRNSISSTEASAQSVVSPAGTLFNFRVNLVVAPGGSASHLFIVRLNGADTQMSCSVVGSATTCTDLTHTVTLAPGDRVSISSTPSGSPAPGNIFRYSLLFNSTTSQETLMAGGVAAVAGATRYAGLAGISINDGTEGPQQVPMASSVTFKNLYVVADSAPGAGKTFTVTFNKGGSGQALTCTISDSATTCNDTTHSFAAVAGDLISIPVVASAGSTSPIIHVGYTVVSANDGESTWVAGSNGYTFSDTATSYIHVSGTGMQPFNTSANPAQNLSQATTAKAIYVQLSGAPGSGNSYALTLEKNGVATALTCTVTGAGQNTTCNLTGQSIAIADGDRLATKCVPTSGPTARSGQVAYLIATSPVTPPSGGSARRIIFIE